jgi:RNA polymerase sigma factor for flagellar operon FliA
VRRALRGLSRVERRVLLLSYAHGFTLKEIGRDVGLSESGVCRMRARALRHLRERCPT